MANPTPTDPKKHTQPDDSPQTRAPLPDPSAAGLKPVEYGQYGMRTEQAGGHGSAHGAASDHESFDAAFSTREARNHRPRTIPTGLSDAPEVDAAQTASGLKPADHAEASRNAPVRTPPAKGE